MKVHIFRGGETLSEFELAEGEYVIGSGESAQLRVASESVAAEHARLRIGSGGAEIEDLGSGRGTFLGELALTSAQPLPHGSIFQIGDVALQVWDDESPAPSGPQRQEDGRYVIGDVIAAGAMGVIRSARELSTGREVAMKQMRDEGAGGSVGVATRFVQEARITAHLEHPNVVPVHDVNPGANGPGFYTMKMVRGISLEKVLDLLRQRAEGSLKKYPLEALLTIFQKVCDAVAFAHSKGIIHRDLKPANLMVGAYGEVLVMDWGLAKVVGEAAAELPATGGEGLAAEGGGGTLAGTVMGTPYYMAPEQAAGDITLVDARSDIYALGGILYELLTLQTPVAGRTTAEVLQQVRDGKIVRPLQRAGTAPLPHLPGGRIPASLAAVALKAMVYSPERRYQSVTDLQAEIRAYQSGFATGAEDAGAWRQFTLLLRRNQAVSTAVAAALVLLGIVSAIYTLGVIRERDRTKSALAETEVQRKRADDALGRLKETAPIFATKSTEFLKATEFDNAIKNLGFALDVAPENTNYRRSRADLLQASGRLAEAIPEYERVLAERPDERTRRNLALSQEVMRENGGALELRSDLRQRLTDAITSQGRASELNLVPPKKPEGMIPLLDADFERGSDGFPLGKSNVDTAVIGGEYQIVLSKGGLWWPPEPPLHKLRLANFVCEVEARLVRAAPDSSWGLGILPSQEPRHPWTGIMINGSGQLGLHLYDEGPFGPWTTTPHMNPIASRNTLRVEVTGPRIRVFINGRFVTERHQPRLYRPCNLTLYAQTGPASVDVRFDRVRVWRFD
jgi:serine/threonine protein kinase